MSLAYTGAGDGRGPQTSPLGGLARRVAAAVASPELLRVLVKLLIAIVVTMAGCQLVRDALAKEIALQRAGVFIRAAGRGFSDRALAELMAGAEPGVIRFAIDHDPDGPQAAWARPPGWKRLDIETVPTLGLSHLSMAEAQRINGVIPNSQIANPPMTPFVLRASAAERGRAVGCLTAAIYYEGALEPREGQEAIAQVVINRMRHAGFPKSICGVVFQGADQPGCQFSFACDGSMVRPPAAWAWRNAKDVAEKALSGYVMRAAGAATHYHTDWIMARWTPTLIKVGRFGSQIFFRPTGPEGQPSAFLATYRGDESRASRLELIGKPATAAPAGLLQASAPGSIVAPASIVRGGRVIILPPGALALGRVHGVIGEQGGLAQDPPQATMHALIALRAAAAHAALRQRALSTPPASPVETASAPVQVSVQPVAGPAGAAG